MYEYQEFVDACRQEVRLKIASSGGIKKALEATLSSFNQSSAVSDGFLMEAQGLILLWRMFQERGVKFYGSNVLDVVATSMSGKQDGVAAELKGVFDQVLNDARGTSIVGDIGSVDKSAPADTAPESASTAPLPKQEWWKLEYKNSVEEVSVPASCGQVVFPEVLDSERQEFFKSCERMVSNSVLTLGEDIALCANGILLKADTINPRDALLRAYKLLLYSDKAVAESKPKLAFEALGYAEKFIQKVGADDRQDEFISLILSDVEKGLAEKREKVASIPRQLGSKKLSVPVYGDGDGQGAIPIDGQDQSLAYPAPTYAGFIKGGAWSVKGKWAEISAEHPNSEISAQYYGGKGSDEIIHAATTGLLREHDGKPEDALKALLGFYKDKSVRPGTVLAVYAAKVALELVSKIASSTDISRPSLLLRRDACMFIVKNLHMRDRKKRSISVSELNLTKRVMSLLQVIKANNKGRIHQQMCGVGVEINQVERRLDYIDRINSAQVSSERPGLRVVSGGKSFALRP